MNDWVNPDRVLGISDGGFSLISATIQNPLFQRLKYVLVEGLFNDDRNYNNRLVADKSIRPRGRSILKSVLSGPIGPSSYDIHSSLTLSGHGILD